jgi:hypothetical protein
MLDESMYTPENATKLIQTTTKHSKIKNEIAECENDWLEVSEELED